MVPETLESRRLYSVVTAVQTNHELTITGSDDTDTINVTEVAVPADNPFGLKEGKHIVFVTYDADGDGVASDTLSAPDGNPFFQGVKTLKMYGNGGDDTLEFVGMDINAHIEGGDGNDTISVVDDQDQNGVGSSTVLGGDGDDNITVVQGNNTVVRGQAGDDSLVAILNNGGGSATLYGESGHDHFEIAGKVTGIGGGGHDDGVIVDGDTDTDAVLLL